MSDDDKNNGDELTENNSYYNGKQDRSMTSNSDIDRDGDGTASNLTFSDMNKSQGFFDPPIENYRFIEFGNSDTGFCFERNNTRRNDFTSQSQNQLPSSREDKEHHLLDQADDDADAQDDSYSCLDSFKGGDKEGGGGRASDYRDDAGINHKQTVMSETDLCMDGYMDKTYDIERITENADESGDTFN